MADHYNNLVLAIRLGIIGKYSFEINSTTSHLTLYFPINRIFYKLTGSKIIILQDHLYNFNLIIIY